MSQTIKVSGPEIPAEEILKKIQDCKPVEYNDAFIVGDLDLRKLDLACEVVYRSWWKQWLRRQEWLSPPKEEKIDNAQSNGIIIIAESTIIGPRTYKAEKHWYIRKWRNLWPKLIYEPKEKVFINKPIKIINSKIYGNIWFSNCIFQQLVDFSGTEFGIFPHSTSANDAFFLNCIFAKDVSFEGAKFSRFAMFANAQFKGENTNFSEVSFKGVASFFRAIFNGHVFFQKAEFYQGAIFSYAKFRKTIFILNSKFHEKFSVEHTKFDFPEMQERIYRRARRHEEEIGNYEKADYYLYNELDGKRKQKGPLNRYLEFLPMKVVFGYGVHPLRLIISWFLIILISALIYWKMGWIKEPVTLSDCIYFSTKNIAILNSGGYTLTSETAQWFVLGEALLGTFLWAAFITTFIRKIRKVTYPAKIAADH